MTKKQAFTKAIEIIEKCLWVHAPRVVSEADLMDKVGRATGGRRLSLEFRKAIQALIEEGRIKFVPPYFYTHTEPSGQYSRTDRGWKEFVKDRDDRLDEGGDFFAESVEKFFDGKIRLKR